VPDHARAQQLRALLSPDGRPLVGISWRSVNKKLGAHKTMALRELLPVLRLPGVRFVNLQYGDTAQELRELREVHGIEVQTCEQVDNHGDIDGLVSLIQACDMVVSTSNTTVHLAGAIGKPTKVLVPFGNGLLWYWGTGNTDTDGRTSLWYPSVELYRQQADLDWSRLVAELNVQVSRLLGP
jgi:ADP-heptose:LPS heptosyltransferase